MNKHSTNESENQFRIPISKSTFDHRTTKDVEMTDSNAIDHSIDRPTRLS
jgi:hypothetical protein